MEAGESGTRQSVFASAGRPDPYLYRLPSDSTERRGRGPPKMAAATLINPTPAYPQSAPLPFAYQQHQPPASMAGLVSPPGEGRRPSNDTDSSSQRQSLPSISEVFSAKPSPYSITAPTTPSGTSGLPPPFGASAGGPPPRTEPAPEARPAHDDNYFRFHPRPEPNPPGHPPPGSPYTFSEPRNLTKPPEPLQPNGSAGSAPPPPPSHPYPPGQYPLSQGSISPRNAPSSFPPYEQQRPPVHSDDEYSAHRNRYDSSTLNRHFEAWDYQDTLYKLSWSARSIFNFAEAYGNIAKEQHGGPPIPERLPSEKEVGDMLNNVNWIKQSLENVREMVQHSIASERAREGGRPKGPYNGDDDVSMYGDGIKQPYGLGEVKKRRGRAAPPGRCHSCNRIDTPEWRRGPDGARTLCNACGLHYAKLERKRQMEQRSIRPKAVE